MNTVILKGIPRDIEYSHSIAGTSYSKCNFYVTDPEIGRTDVVQVKFRTDKNRFIEGQEISFYGNIRSHSENVHGANKVSIYVYTYQDLFENTDSDYNYIELDGRVCKTYSAWLKNGILQHSFIVANNIFSSYSKINSYIPCCTSGELAESSKQLKVSDQIKLIGKIRSKTYIKRDQNNEPQIHVAHEVEIIRMEKIN